MNKRKSDDSSDNIFQSNNPTKKQNLIESYYVTINNKPHLIDNLTIKEIKDQLKLSSLS